MDVWVMRKADDARLHFWGISQMERESALEAIAATKSIWFLGDVNSELDSYWCAHKHLLIMHYLCIDQPLPCLKMLAQVNV